MHHIKLLHCSVCVSTDASWLEGAQMRSVTEAINYLILQFTKAFVLLRRMKSWMCENYTDEKRLCCVSWHLRWTRNKIRLAHLLSYLFRLPNQILTLFIPCQVTVGFSRLQPFKVLPNFPGISKNPEKKSYNYIYWDNCVDISKLNININQHYYLILNIRLQFQQYLDYFQLWQIFYMKFQFCLMYNYVNNKYKLHFCVIAVGLLIKIIYT